MGPIIGGAIASAGAWRWIFWLNLPICAFAAVMVTVFLKVKTPEGSVSQKLARMDWMYSYLPFLLHNPLSHEGNGSAEVSSPSLEAQLQSY